MLPILTRLRIQSVRTARDNAVPVADIDLMHPPPLSLAVPGNRWSRLARLGGLASGSFYVPYKGVKKWSWETYWLVGGFFWG